MSDYHSQLAGIRDEIFGAQQQAETPEQVDDETPAPEEAEGEAETHEEPEQEEAIEEDEGETPPATLGETYTPAELAKAIGLEPTELYRGLTVKLDSGETIPLGQIKDRLQRVSHDSEAVAKQRQAFETERQQFHAFAQQSVGAMQQLSEAEQQAYGAIQAAQAEFDRIDWARLDEKRARKVGKRETADCEPVCSRETAAGGSAAAAAADHAAAAAASDPMERAAVDGTYAGMARPRELHAETRADGEYLAQKGYSPQELAQRIDYRDRVLVHKARLWDEHLARIAEAKGRVRTAPKSLAPGQGASRAKASRRVETLEARARETGDQSDILAAARAIIGSKT